MIFSRGGKKKSGAGAMALAVGIAGRVVFAVFDNHNNSTCSQVSRDKRMQALITRY